MGFIVGEITSVKRKVEFALLNDFGVPQRKADMLVTFRVRNTEESKVRAEMLKEYTAKTQREFTLLEKDPKHELDLPEGDFDSEFLREDIENIEGLLNPDKSEIEFSPDILEQVLLDRIAKAALIQAWSELNLATGLKRKN